MSESRRDPWVSRSLICIRSPRSSSQARDTNDLVLVRHADGGMLAVCGSGPEGRDNLRAVVNLDGIGFVQIAESGPESPAEELRALIPHLPPPPARG